MYKLGNGLLFTILFLLTAQLQAQMVYITKTGARYHKESCRYSKTGWASDLAAAKKKGLTACLVCKPSSTETGEAKPIPLSTGLKVNPERIHPSIKYPGGQQGVFLLMIQFLE